MSASRVARALVNSPQPFIMAVARRPSRNVSLSDILSSNITVGGRCDKLAKFLATMKCVMWGHVCGWQRPCVIWTSRVCPAYTTLCMVCTLFVFSLFSGSAGYEGRGVQREFYDRALDVLDVVFGEAKAAKRAWLHLAKGVNWRQYERCKKAEREQRWKYDQAVPRLAEWAFLSGLLACVVVTPHTHPHHRLRASTYERRMNGAGVTHMVCLIVRVVLLFFVFPAKRNAARHARQWRW